VVKVSEGPVAAMPTSQKSANFADFPLPKTRQRTFATGLLGQVMGFHAESVGYPDVEAGYGHGGRRG
jgi:hypothetical protein